MTGPLPIGADAPDFEAETTEGRIRFHEWLGNAWGVLFSHPKDFTPVCTTELGYMARIKPEFDKRGVKVIGLSIDPVDSHVGWSKGRTTLTPGGDYIDWSLGAQANWRNLTAGVSYLDTNINRRDALAAGATKGIVDSAMVLSVGASF